MKIILTGFFFLLLGSLVLAQVDARMLKYPDVSAKYITFEYGGDIWIVPKEGGIANRLSSPKGEEALPKFSPDGSKIAYSANYDGNVDVFVIPTLGGMPVRLTHNGMTDRIVDWYSDGQSILYASSMESGKQRFSQFYKESIKGGLPEKLLIPMAEFGSFSPDGKKIAYTPMTRSFRTWKRYRGGWAADIWIFDLEKLTAENITNNPANDEFPMWHNNTIYFLSDRDANERNNIWSYDMNTKTFKQITNFTDFDVHFPSIGPDDIVFEAGGSLYLLDLATEKYHEVKIDVVSDVSTLMPKSEKVDKYIKDYWPSPDGKRAVFEARGDLFSVPAENGNVYDLTNTSGYAERFPSWAPDGRYIAYWSDKSGEYELTIKDMEKPNEEKNLTSYGPGYRYQIFWSPNCKMLSFIDKAMKIFVYDVDKDKTTQIDKAEYKYEGGLESFKMSWSSDSRYVAYSREVENTHGAEFVYDTKENEVHQLTSGYYDDGQPFFDPDGKYLYYLTNRSFNPVYGDYDGTFVYPNTTNIAAVALVKDTLSPMAPKNDLSEIKKEEKKESDQEDKKKEEATKKEEKTKEKTKEIKIDFTGFEERAVILPPEGGNYNSLSAISGKIIYQRMPNSGSESKKKPIDYYDLEKREEKNIVDDADSYQLTANNKKILIALKGSFYITDIAPEQKLEKKMPVGEMKMTIVPREEWRQIFNDTWRFERDFFYDPNMHGVNWNQMRELYGKLVDYAVTRWDLNYILGELIGELNSSHTYKIGGDVEEPEKKGVGYLGVDWELANGAYRIKKIIRGAEWDAEVRSPLDESGVNVKEGDYILAVNDVPIDVTKDPWAAFEGLDDQTVVLTVNNKPTMDGVRKVTVKTLKDETRLRNLAWIEANRQRVDKATDGKIGYIYVPDTGINGQTELVRQFFAQYKKQGLIIDERFNSGGQIPDRFVEMLNRKPLAFFAVRDGINLQVPYVANFGPKVMIINGWSGSGGDAFPDFFKKEGVGPLVGKRTWGGLIGISGAPSLIDGGNITVPTFRQYNPDGTWFAEGHGVDPNYEVEEDPGQLAKGIDTQLEKTISVEMDLLKKNPPINPKQPSYQNRTPGGN